MLVAVDPLWVKLVGDVGGDVSLPTPEAGQALVLANALMIGPLTPFTRGSTPSWYLVPQRRLANVYAIVLVFATSAPSRETSYPAAFLMRCQVIDKLPPVTCVTVMADVLLATLLDAAPAAGA